MFIQADAVRLPFAENSFDLVLGSPPYCDARSYGIAAQRSATEWVEWMLNASEEACRVSKGLVLWVCAGVTRKWNYWPACEGLMWEWFKRGNRQWRPAFWHRVGIPGSGGKQWLRADIEYVLAFTSCQKAIPWADNTANGHPPKWGPGGEMSYRMTDGTRINQWGKTGSMTGTTATGKEKSTIGKPRPSHQQLTPRLPGPNRRANGKMKGVRRAPAGAKNGDVVHDENYMPPTLANPGCLVQGIITGGGSMGAPEAHENEAPFPLKLAQWFIRGWCPPAGRVLDPFSGSGTTVHAALSLGRVGVGCDLRFSQCQLGARRCADVQPEMFV